MSDQLEPAVVKLIEGGSMISAIKKLRELRNIGLKEAKQLVDAHVNGNTLGLKTQTKIPPPKTVERSHSNNKLLLIVIVIITGSLLYLYNA